MIRGHGDGGLVDMGLKCTMCGAEDYAENYGMVVVSTDSWLRRLFNGSKK